MAVTREDITVRVFQSHAEEEAADREWWLQIPPDERVELAWRLSEDLYRMLGKFPDVKTDFVDLLQAFAANDVRFLIIGAYALAHHGRPRATGDLDVWVDPDPENAKKVMAALREFGAPMRDLSEQDFARPSAVFQIGLPPCRVDVLTQISGLTFPEAWQTRTEGTLGACRVSYIGKQALIKNKRAAGRPKDLVDAQDMEDTAL